MSIERSVSVSATWNARLLGFFKFNPLAALVAQIDQSAARIARIARIAQSAQIALKASTKGVAAFPFLSSSGVHSRYFITEL